MSWKDRPYPRTKIHSPASGARVFIIENITELKVEVRSLQENSQTVGA